MNKPTWIFVCGSYRTASTTQYRMVRDIVEETKNGIGIGYHTEKKLKQFDDPAECHDARYVVCKVFEYLPDGLHGDVNRKERKPWQPSYGMTLHKEKRIRAIMTVRDPRDIITSMRARTERDKEKWFEFDRIVREALPVWLNDARKWANLGPGLSLVSRFEDFTADLLGETQRIAEFLDISLSTQKAREIASRYTTDAITEHKRKSRAAKKREDPWLPSVPGILFGKPGAWQSHLTPEEAGLVVKHSRAYMEEFGYL